jgi:hypothetical protein
MRRVSRVSIRSGACVFLLCSLAAADQKTAPRYPTGMLPTPPDLRNQPGTRVEWVTTSTGVQADIPTQCRNIQHLPVVRAQALANCGAFAPSYYYKTYQEAREHGWIRPDPSVNPERVMSPGFTYPLTNGGQNNGAGLHAVLSVICRYGIATWADMPEESDFSAYPPDDMWAKALPFRGSHILAFDVRDSAGVLELKAHLAGGDLAILGILVTDATHFSYPNGQGTQNEVIYANVGDGISHHAFTLVGYDDTKPYSDGATLRYGAFLAVNSWGPGWGVTIAEAGSGGFCWFGYEYVMSGASEGSAFAMVDRIGYAPRETAEVAVSHTHRYELYLGLQGGTSTNILDAFPRGGGALPYNGRITLDVTDLTGEAPLIYTLLARDLEPAASGSAAVGTIHDFAVHKEDGTVLRCDDVPATLNEDHGILSPSPLILQTGAVQQHYPVLEGDALAFCRLAVADFDRDGDPDLAMAGNPSMLLINDGLGNLRDAGFALTDFVLNGPATVLSVLWGDVDRDGYQDLLMEGERTEGGRAALLYRNTGGLGFAPAQVLPAGAAAAYAFGDLDHDGDLDLVTSEGRVYWNEAGTLVDGGIPLAPPEVYARRTVSVADIDNDGYADLEIQGELLYNNGDGTFRRKAGVPAPDFVGGYATTPPVWQDFDGDGLLDALAGVLYLNQGFVAMIRTTPPPPTWYWTPELFQQTACLPGRTFEQLAVADFDRDGDLDAALSGSPSGVSYADLVCELYQQRAGITFADTGLVLPGIINGGLAWADWDGDGDLGLLVCGNTGLVSGETPYDPRLCFYACRYADFGQPNQPPQPPSGLTVTLEHGDLLLAWNDGADAETATGALWYGIRVGTRMGGTDVVSPLDPFHPGGMARRVGTLDPPEPVGSFGEHWKNVGERPGFRLKCPAAGRYFFGVRTVDTSWARSDWSASRSFTVAASGIVEGDVNADGFVDVADVVCARRMAAGHAAPDPARADLDGDGAVSARDAWAIARRVLALPAEGYAPLVSGEIGTAGGTLARDGFELVVPPGALPATATLAVFVSPDEGWFGDSTPRYTYEIRGLPTALQGSLTVRAPDTRAGAEVDVRLAVGLWSRPYDIYPADGLDLCMYTALPGAPVSGGCLEAVIPAAWLAGASAKSAAGLCSAPAPFTFDVRVGFFSNSYTMKTPHCLVDWDGVAPVNIIQLGTELENAFALYTSKGFDFEPKRNWTNLPLQVHIREVTAGDDGGLTHNTDDGAFMDIHPQTVGNDPARRSTVYHEIFHLVQGLVNPASPEQEGRDMEQLFLDEATAVWAEKLGAPDPATYYPETYNAYKQRLMDGLTITYAALGGLDRREAARCGYGYAALIEFLDARYGDAVVKRMYDGIVAGKRPFQALFDAPGPAVTDWHHPFYKALLQDEIYRGRFADFMCRFGGSATGWPDPWKQHDVRDAATAAASFAPRLAPLDVDVYRLTFHPAYLTNFTATSALAFSCSNADADRNLSVI